MDETMEWKRHNGTFALLTRFMRRKWRIAAKVAAGTAAVMALSALSILVPQPRSYRTRESLMTHVEQSPGVVESLRRKGVGSRFDGTVRQVLVAAGHPVRKGQILFKMDTAGAESALEAAKAEAEVARKELRGTYAARAADLVMHEADVASARSALREARRATGQEWTVVGEGPDTRLAAVTPGETLELTGLRAGLQNALLRREEQCRQWDPALQAARESVAVADREIRRLIAEIAAGTRRSPFTGVVSKLYAKTGEHVTAGRPIVRIDDPAGYRVVARVGEKVRKSLKPGARLKLSSTAGPAAGTLEKVVDGFDRELFLYYLWVKPRNASMLVPGETVVLKLPAATMALN